MLRKKCKLKRGIKKKTKVGYALLERLNRTRIYIYIKSRRKKEEGNNIYI